MNGNDIIVILSKDGSALASTCVKSQDIQTGCSTTERASATQQEWEEHVAGRKNWSISISYLVMRAAQVRDILYVGQTFDVQVVDRGNTTGGSVIGKAILVQAHNVASRGNLATGSWQLKGTGALT